MEPADGVGGDVVTTTITHWRGALIGVGLAGAVGLLVLLAPAPAHADDDPGAGLLSGVVGGIAEQHPVQSLTDPLAATVDSLLGGSAARLPVLGGALGDQPAGAVVTPVAQLVDGALGGVASIPLPAVPVPSLPTPTEALPEVPLGDGPSTGIPEPATASGVDAVAALTRAVPVVVAAGIDLAERAATAVVAPDFPLPGGPIGLTGTSSPTAVSGPGGGYGGLVAAVLAGGLFLMLARGRIRLSPVHAPPSPVFDTDSSPD